MPMVVLMLVCDASLSDAIKNHSKTLWFMPLKKAKNISLQNHSESQLCEMTVTQGYLPQAVRNAVYL